MIFSASFLLVLNEDLLSFFQEVSTSSIMKNISMTSKQIKITEEPLLAPEVTKYSDGRHSPRFTSASATESDYESNERRAHNMEGEPRYRPVTFVPNQKCQSVEGSKSIAKPVFAQPPSPNNWQTQSSTYYQSVAGQPIHNAIETVNSMQMHEKSETNQRVVNMQSSTKIINFNNQLYGDPEPFPYAASPTYDHVEYSRNRLAPPPTPTKFVKGDFKESDYDSEIESAKIRPVWTPVLSDSDEPHYRRVNAPRPSRSSSCPRSQDQQAAISPLVFDTQPPYQPTATYSTQTLGRSSTKQQHQTTTTMNHVQSKANEMSHEFKRKAQNFIGGFDKREGDKVTPPQKSVEPQVYRDGSRVSQYGKSPFPYSPGVSSSLLDPLIEIESSFDVISRVLIIDQPTPSRMSDGSTLHRNQAH